MDEYGRLNKQRKGSDFEELFGIMNNDYYHSRIMPKILEGENLHTMFGDLEITSSEVKAVFTDGTPAVTVNKYGKGTATMFNFEAGRIVFEPGNILMEKIVTFYTLGDIRPQFNVSTKGETMVFRRSGQYADHYFFINDGLKTDQVTVSTDVIHYKGAQDLIDNKDVTISGNKFVVAVPAASATWVRVEKE
jgi:hypothetical protein